MNERLLRSIAESLASIAGSLLIIAVNQPEGVREYADNAERSWHRAMYEIQEAVNDE
jgi:hypothetical protein